MIRATAVLLLLAAPAAAGSFLLGQPVDCSLGQDCFIQNYVDRDPGKGAADFKCGELSYDGHKGTDFALPTLAAMHKGVAVIAAAPGTVIARRDGEADTGRANAAPDRECGNGVIIRHGGDWQTQYCHLKKGSVQVKVGQRVAKGTPLGMIGLSGNTEFPHLHLSVRHDKQVVDPFDSRPGAATCMHDHAQALWHPPLPYTAGAILDVGFSAVPPSFDDVKAGIAQTDVGPGSDSLVFWSHAYGGQTGDSLILSVTGPQGFTVTSPDSALDRSKARFFKFIGKRRGETTWPAGIYTGTATLFRNGQPVSEKELTLQIRP